VWSVSRKRVQIQDHIERDEIPDDAAVREVFEETGLSVELVGEKREDVEEPVQLHRPAGVQLENISPGTSI
jgi:8-oxo-dGTP pyrophosphatase MutT (NUDIX family)